MSRKYEVSILMKDRPEIDPAAWMIICVCHDEASLAEVVRVLSLHREPAEGPLMVRAVEIVNPLPY